MRAVTEHYMCACCTILAIVQYSAKFCKRTINILKLPKSIYRVCGMGEEKGMGVERGLGPAIYKMVCSFLADIHYWESKYGPFFG